MDVQYSIEIHAKPAEVFPWIADPEKAVLWQPDVQHWEIIEKRGDVIGTVFRETVGEGSNSLEMKGFISKYQLNQEIGFHLESKVHTIEMDYTIRSNADVSVVSIHAQIHWKFPVNIICLFSGKKMKASLLNQMEAESNALKRICEKQGSFSELNG